MIGWGVKKAEEMGVEMWADATSYGIPLCEKHGFVVVNENNLCPQRDDKDKDDQWRKIEGELGPLTMWQMWRHVGGKYEEGLTQKPWEI